MDSQSLPQSEATQSQPPGSADVQPPSLEGVWLSQEEWTEATDIDMAFYAALGCEADNPHKLELLKSVQIRYARFVARVDGRLHPTD